jgi:hypothetical protein
MQIGPFHSNNAFNTNFDSLDFDPLDQIDNSSLPFPKSDVKSMSDLFSDDLLSKLVSKGSEKIYIEKITYFQIDTQTENDDTFDAREIDFENNPEQVNKANELGELLIDALLSDGQRVQKTSSRMAEQIRSKRQINIYDQNGNAQGVMNVQDMNIHAFTSSDLKLLSYLIFASFAAQEARKQLEDEKKRKAENKRREDAELEETLRQNLNKSHHKEEIKPLIKNNDNKEVKIAARKSENNRLIFKRLIEILNEDKVKNKVEKKLESIKSELIKFIKSDRLKKSIQTELEDKDLIQETISIAQAIKNLSNKEI